MSYSFTAKKRSQRQKRLFVFLNRRRFDLLLAIRILAILVILGSFYWLWEKHWWQTQWQAVEDAAISQSVKFGLTIQQVPLIGRRYADRNAIMGILGDLSGEPILSFDVDDAKARLEALPWIKQTRIERRLPNTLSIAITEYIPTALWQYQGQVALIDETGHVILPESPSEFYNLPRVIGEGANEKATDLLAIIYAEPALRDEFKTATFINGRRWDIVFQNGLIIKLPEKNAAEAWARLAGLARDHQILSKKIKILDLRLPDRITLHLPEGESVIPFMQKGI